MNKCHIAKDLIPLYVEGLTNEDSSTFVEKHIEECADCHGHYERIKQDYEQIVPEQPDGKHLDDLLTKLAKYQRNIKLIVVLIAMFLSCVFTGMGGQFLATLPLIIMTPFFCRLLYHKSWPIILSALPFGVVGAMLSEESSSYILFFTAIALVATFIGTTAATAFKHGENQLKASWKAVYVIPAVAMITLSSVAYFSFFGNPFGYMEALIKTKQYVNQTYEEGTLAFKGVKFNFKDKQHYGHYEYTLNGTRQTAPIGFYPNGEINDYYKFVLASQFSEERSADLKTAIAVAIDYAPVMIEAHPEEELAITQDELNFTYYHLTYDVERRDKATALRKSESSKLNYEISFGAFSGEYDPLTREEFTAKVNAIRAALTEHDIPFHQIVIKAKDENGNPLSSSFHSA